MRFKAGVDPSLVLLKQQAVEQGARSASLAVYVNNLCNEVRLWSGMGLRRMIRLDRTYVPHRLVDAGGSVTDSELLQHVLSQDLDEQHLLVFGPGGIGKSALLAHWVLDLSASARAPLVPIFVPLGSVRFDGREEHEIPVAAAAAGMFRNADDSLNPELVREIQDTISHGRAVILLDAADEVSQADRGRLRRWLDRVRLSVGGCPIVLTSRPSSDLLGLKNFRPFLLQPLDPSRRRQFFLKWFEATEDVESGVALSREFATRRSVQTSVIAGNPLFLTMICVQYEQDRTIAPTSAALVDQFSRTLLDLWDRERAVPRVRLPLDLKLRALEFLGMYFVGRAAHELEDLDVYQHVQDALNASRLGGSARRILEEIEGTSGLLVFARNGRCRFSHPVFEEYFAASYIARRMAASERDAWLDRCFYAEPGHPLENIVQFYREIVEG